jgi:hypothetical protein
MSHEHRIKQLEQAKNPPTLTTFRMCTAPAGLDSVAHEVWHADRAEFCFTLNLGDCEVSG